MDLARSTTGITTNAYETFAASKAYLDTRVRDTVCDHFGGTTVSKCELARRGVWVGEGAARIQTVTPKEINAAYATERGARKATNGLKARACCYYSHSVSIKRLAALLRAQFPTLPEDVCKKHALRYMREVKEASPLGTNKTSNDDIDNKTTVYDDTRDAQGQRIKPGGIDRAGRRKGTEGCTDVNSHYFVFMGYQIAAAPADAPAAAPATAEGSGGPPEVAAFIVPDGVDSPQPAARGAGFEDADTEEDEAPARKIIPGAAMAEVSSSSDDDSDRDGAVPIEADTPSPAPTQELNPAAAQALQVAVDSVAMDPVLVWRNELHNRVSNSAELLLINPRLAGSVADLLGEKLWPNATHTIASDDGLQSVITELRQPFIDETYNRVRRMYPRAQEQKTNQLADDVIHNFWPGKQHLVDTDEKVHAECENLGAARLFDF